MSEHDEHDEIELLDVEHDQSLADSIADLRALADGLEDAGEELTIEYGDQSATVPAPTGDVEFELEVEREGNEYELEIELEWTGSTDEFADTEAADDFEAEDTKAK